MRTAVTAVATIVATLLALVPPAPAAHADADQPDSAVPLREAVALLVQADERREGYSRDRFRHWIDADRDGCSTRFEVLLVEAVDPPSVGAGCVLTGGRWYSSYDDTIVTEARRLDIDHLVPLAEAWDSGAHSWSAERRTAFANDLDDPRALLAVTASSNRAKGDQDPATWMPPYVHVRCDYIADWVAMKTRWRLSVDAVEKEVLHGHATQCPDAPIRVEIVPDEIPGRGAPIGPPAR